MEINVCSELERNIDLPAVILLVADDDTLLDSMQKLWLLASLSERCVTLARVRWIFIDGMPIVDGATSSSRFRFKVSVFDGENSTRFDFSRRCAISGGMCGFGFSFGGLWKRARFDDSRVGAIGFDCLK